MTKLLLFCGAMLLLTGTMIVLNLRRIARGKRGRRKDVLLLVLWGIVFTVFLLPFILIAATPHKSVTSQEAALHYEVSDQYGTVCYRYRGGKVLSAPPGVLYDTAPGRPEIYRTEDPSFPYYAAYKGKYYPLQYDHSKGDGYPEAG